MSVLALRKALFLENDHETIGPYIADMLRRLVLNTATEGVCGATQLKVSQRGAGANLSVDVAAGYGVVKGDDAGDQGSYLEYNDATVNLDLTTHKPGSNKRYVTVCLRQRDSQYSGLIDLPDWHLIDGSIATNPSVPAIGNTELRLADVLIASSDSSIVDAVITDRRVQSEPTLLAGIYEPKANKRHGVFNMSFNGSTASGTVPFSTPFPAGSLPDVAFGSHSITISTPVVVSLTADPTATGFSYFAVTSSGLAFNGTVKCHYIAEI